ncbi:hypothetical protein Daus18300_002239 [Diaporthe australafricana]|uniref:Secreted protein n=1 Tax=Diaporthe australafricana TaxID=127596 RepID=A0ABR3XQ80_9PEZI
MPSILTFAGVCATLLTVCNASQQLLNTTHDLDVFLDPPSRERPRFRYWLPDASVDPETVRSDIRAAGEIGAGGVEFLPYYNYGGELGPPPSGVNWSTYGFGTPPFLELFKSALETHKEAGLAMDFALGPNQGQGIPAHKDDEGLQWDLFSTTVTVPKGGVVNGTAPGWAAGELVAAVSAAVVSRTKVSYNVTGHAGTSIVVYDDLVLKNGSLADMTASISGDGTFVLELPPTSPAESGYELFFFYQKLSGNQNVQFASNVSTTIWDNGSYNVDHFSSKGAQAIRKFWEEYILVDNVKDLVREVGNYGWEDSIEIRSNISWTPTLPARFKEMFGYDLRSYLPLIMFRNNNLALQTDSPGSTRSTLDTLDQGEGYVNDFRAALAAGYQEYLTTLSQWLQELGVQLSAQPSYNLPMDMEASIPYVEAPECESLGWKDNVDGYRQFSGAANLARKNVISNEMGAVFGRAYSYTIPELLFSVNRAVSGGVNQFVIHGQSYSGNYPKTTWPGYTAFIYYFSDLYSPKRPDWNNGLQAALDYTARIQHIQQKGIPRTDIAFYNKQTEVDPEMKSLYQSDDLINEDMYISRWSYSYLSPDNFALPQAYVSNKLLAPEDAKYQAFVVLGSQNLAEKSLIHLKEFAQAGLPIVVAGGVPGQYASQTKTAAGNESFDASLDELLTHDNVYRVAEGEVATKLESLGLRPRVGVRTNGTWYTTWRDDVSGGTEYAYVFCDTVEASGDLVVQSVGTPYFFDAWTGTRTPVLNYKVEGNTTTVPLNLAANQTKIVAFSETLIEDVQNPGIHATEVSPNILDCVATEDGILFHAAASSEPTLITLSTGDEVRREGQAPPSFELKSWDLVLEHWEAPEDLSDASVTAVKSNSTHQLESLISWTDIPAATNTSGIGYYHTHFTWPPASELAANISQGAYVEFPPVLDAITAYVNGRRLPSLDYADPVADITPYLAVGNNEISVVVPSTMWNYIRSILPDILSSGRPVSQFQSLPKTENGLIGTVNVVPFEVIRVRA